MEKVFYSDQHQSIDQDNHLLNIEIKGEFNNASTVTQGLI